MLAGAARGTLFTVTGTGQPLFERIESEISGYYLIGVESELNLDDIAIVGGVLERIEEQILDFANGYRIVEGATDFLQERIRQVGDIGVSDLIEQVF